MEHVLLDVERRVRPVEGAGRQPGHARAQDQVLRPRRDLQGVDLHEPEARDRGAQRRRRPPEAGDGETAQRRERGRLHHGCVTAVGARPPPDRAELRDSDEVRQVPEFHGTS
jgi:hypothetical protein